ncbi:class I SAM-dependent methyltransferase [Chloroflexota bacterium]
MNEQAARFQEEKDAIRRRLCKYTKKAFQAIPPLDKPQILDIGCGSGESTIELADVFNGEFTCMDIDREMLDVFAGKVEKAGLQDRVKIIEKSMLDMDFPAESFDIIVAEGSIHAVGFEQGLKEWRRLLKPEGCMIVHDAQGDIEGKIKQISACGYDLLDYFKLSINDWWDEYFTPLENMVKEAEVKYADKNEIAEKLREARWEIEMFRTNPENNSSVCFIIRKK